jgi:hypothetical protein
VSAWPLALAIAAVAANGHARNAGDLPVCANRVINQVVKRVGCTVGDRGCWLRLGGFCTDYVEKRLGTERAAKATPIAPGEVRKGDVAVFASRAHMALVESVARDASGRPVAVDVAELNYGTCWVDGDALVTEKYGLVTRRRGVALRDVDGGFLRPPLVAR